MTTAMLRSHAIVEETKVKQGAMVSRRKHGEAFSVRDDGAGEEYADTCCRTGCNRMALWFRDGAHGYCDEHWKHYLRNHRYAVDAKASGVCLKCYKVSVDSGSMCSECLDKQRQLMAGRGVENRAKGLCWCGRKPRKGKATCEACIANNARRVRERRDQGLCACGAKRFGALSTCYGCWMIHLRSKDKREEEKRVQMQEWEDSMAEGLE